MERLKHYILTAGSTVVLIFLSESIAMFWHRERTEVIALMGLVMAVSILTELICKDVL